MRKPIRHSRIHLVLFSLFIGLLPLQSVMSTPIKPLSKTLSSATQLAISCQSSVIMGLGLTYSANSLAQYIGYGGECSPNPTNYTNDPKQNVVNTYLIAIKGSGGQDCYNMVSGQPVNLCPGTYAVTYNFTMQNYSGNTNGWGIDQWTGPGIRNGTLLWSNYTPTGIPPNSVFIYKSTAKFTITQPTVISPPVIYSIGNGNAFTLNSGTVTYQAQ